MPAWYEEGVWGEAGREGVIERGRQALPDGFPIAWLRRRCEQEEHMLRLQYEGGQLPPRDEAFLARFRADDPATLFHRRIALGHLWIKRDQDLRPVSEEESLETLRQLLLREPIEVEVAGHAVEVTDRSYACLYQLARHELRLRELAREEDALEEAEQEALAAMARDGRSEEGEAEIGRILARRRTLHEAMSLHRQAIYAHLMTPDGAPAESLDDAPDWWREVGPIEDLVLREAVREAGARRLSRLGEMPDRPEDGSPEARRLEDFGWVQAFADIDKADGLPPATSIRQPFGQVIAHRRASADPVASSKVP